MQIFLYVDSPDIADCAAELAAEISAWVIGCHCSAEAINTLAELDDDPRLGLHLNTSKRAVLKNALDALYAMAKTHQVDFSVGYIDSQQVAHKVCFFGDEEGRPDVSEIASYLGLKR